MWNYLYQNKKENKDENQRNLISIENQTKIRNISISKILNDGRLAGFDKNMKKFYILNKKDYSFDLEIKIPEILFYDFYEIKNNHFIYFVSDDKYSYSREFFDIEDNYSTIKIIQLFSQNAYKTLNTISLNIPIDEIKFEVSSNGIIIIGYRYPFKKYDILDICHSNEIKFIYCFNFYIYSKEAYQIIRKIEYNNIIDVFFPHSQDKIFCLNDSQIVIKQYTSLTFIDFNKGNLVHTYKEDNQQIDFVKKYSKDTILINIMKNIDGEGDISIILIYNWQKHIILKKIKNNFDNIFLCINGMIFANYEKQSIKIYSLIEEEFIELQDLKLKNFCHFKHLNDYIYVFYKNENPKEIVLYQYKINDFK